MTPPKFDIIVFGATSFVGEILCRYLLQEFGSAPTPGARKLSWAIAGRSPNKLAALRSALGKNAVELGIIVADAADESTLTAMCRQTRVVVSTVGPYALYGEPLIKVCSELGTDYCDLTGEPQWMRRMISRYSAATEKSGARIVHCCGFDSIPSDLGVWFLQQQAIQHYGEPCVKVKMRVKAMCGAASGGTVASMINIVKEATHNPELRRELSNPYSLCPPDTPAAITKARQTHIKSAVFDTDFAAWSAPFVMQAINVRVVLRSNALMGQSNSGQPAVPGFCYDEAMLVGKGFAGRAKAWSVTAGLTAFVAGVALPPIRWGMEKFMLPAPGEGPSLAAQASGFYDLRFVGRTPDGRQLRVKVTGDRDPGYGSTGKMLGEAAACLALDIGKEKLAGGFWTPATAMGDLLLKRLEAHAGLKFVLLEN